MEGSLKSIIKTKRMVEKNMPCPKCSSSDAYNVWWDDIKGYNGGCFSCGVYVHDPYSGQAKSETTSSLSTNEKGNTTKMSIAEVLTYPVRELNDRSLTKETCEAFGVRVSLSERDGVTPTSHYYPVYKKDKLSGFKERQVKDKKFFTSGDCTDPELFGQHRIKNPSKTLYITEGELDALSLYQVLRKYSSYDDWDPSVVSLARGSAAAASDIANNYEFVDSFEKVVLLFDNDTPGLEATEAVAKILAGKAFIGKIELKDANDMIMAGKGNDLYWAVMKNARKYQPDGIINGADTWDRFLHSSNQECYPYPDEWQEVNKMTYGARGGSVVIITSGTGAGKTTAIGELKHHFFKTTDFKIADIALEEDLGDTVGNQMALYLNKRILLPDVHVSEDELRKAHDYVYSSRRWELYDHFGGMDDDTLFTKLRYFAASGCKFIFLDHLSIIISEYADKGNERERIDSVMTKIVKLAKEFNIIIFLVVHLKKTTGGVSFEEGYEPNLDDLRGSASLKQLATDIFSLSRNQQHTDKICANTSLLHVLKCRFTGRTGTADALYFDHDTGRMTKTEVPLNYYPEDKSKKFNLVDSRF